MRYTPHCLLKGTLVLLKAFNLVHFISFGVCGNFHTKGGEVVKNKNNLGRRCSDVFISALEATGSLLLQSFYLILLRTQPQG